MMALAQQLRHFPSPVSLVVSDNCRPPTVRFPKQHLFLLSSYSSRKPLLLFATPPSSASPIFLPYLHEHEQDDDRAEQEDVQDAAAEYGEDHEHDDPIRRFFRSRTSTLDPPLEARFSLQVNRRSSWHLSSFDAAEDDAESDHASVGKEYQKGSQDLEPRALPPEPDGVVREILRIARHLPANSTLGEFLGDFNGRISSRECLQVRLDFWWLPCDCWRTSARCL